jgi:Putative  PD-(D/E)XK family member, (DUF4420)
MSSIKSIWEDLHNAGQRGGSRRVYEERGHDFYAALNADGLPGLQLLTSDEPPASPEFDVVDISIVQRPDKKWLISIWLRDASLAEVFGELCQSLVESARDVAAGRLPAFVFLRLLSWQRLLEAGSGNALGVNALRGLVGELLVFERCLTIWAPGVVANGWTGPFNAPQDFVLPSTLIEVKTVLRAAPTIRVSSIEQLDVPAETSLRLAVVSLIPFTPDEPPSFSPALLTACIRETLIADPEALKTFDDKLGAAGYGANEVYEKTYFRLQGLEVYDVRPGFPRLERARLPKALTKASYEINMGSCEAFRSKLEAS